MTVPLNLLKVLHQWIERAEEDLRNAEYTLTLKEDCPFGTVCFHAQQCTEKYIKALLVWKSIDFPKTHDLGELYSLLPPEFVIPTKPEEQELLTRYATVTRYPGDWEPLTRQSAEEAVSITRKAREAAQNFLPKEVFKTRENA